MERAIKEIWLLFWYNITVVLVQQKDTEKGLHCCSGTTKTAFYGACTVVLVHTFIDIYHIPQVFYLNNTTGEQSDGECPTIPDYSDAPEAPVRIVGKHLSGLRDALRQHICGEAALELHSGDSP